jgi:hypothetical protein
VSHDVLIRTIAVVAAAALLAAPYWEHIAAIVDQAAAAARKHVALLTRLAAALLIVAAAWGKIPLPDLPGVVDVPAVVVPEPRLKEVVEGAMKQAIGMDSVAVTPALRARYGETARAIAWAGINGG